MPLNPREYLGHGWTILQREKFVDQFPPLPKDKHELNFTRRFHHPLAGSFAERVYAHYNHRNFFVPAPRIDKLVLFRARQANLYSLLYRVSQATGKHSLRVSWNIMAVKRLHLSQHSRVNSLINSCLLLFENFSFYFWKVNDDEYTRRERLTGQQWIPRWRRMCLWFALRTIHLLRFDVLAPIVSSSLTISDCNSDNSTTLYAHGFGTWRDVQAVSWGKISGILAVDRVCTPQVAAASGVNANASRSACDEEGKEIGCLDTPTIAQVNSRQTVLVKGENSTRRVCAGWSRCTRVTRRPSESYVSFAEVWGVGIEWEWVGLLLALVIRLYVCVCVCVIYSY